MSAKDALLICIFPVLTDLSERQLVLRVRVTQGEDAFEAILFPLTACLGGLQVISHTGPSESRHLSEIVGGGIAVAGSKSRKGILRMVQAISCPLDAEDAWDYFGV